ncbi:MAG: carboxylesterase family protein [Gammaproteobacteria bacterium]|nr:carboxylesterase family protein [Gammaproteobacteria bacterium]
MTASGPAPDPAVAVGDGLIRGRFADGIYSFKGIPYAAPIEGINRWLAPKPPPVLAGTFDATQFGPSAPQNVPSVPGWLMPKAGAAMMEMLGGMTEPGPACLSLNVWTSAEPSVSHEKQPVIFFIHGGGLASGGSSPPTADGGALAKRGTVVVVSINYRLGGIGFLAADGLFDDNVCVGNRGFMDVVAALQWVQDNIEQFGGDPNNVTVVGQSAGGTCVWALLSSPTSEGLFHRAVVMSGPIVMIDIADHHRFTRDVLKAMKVPVGDVEALAGVSNDVIVGSKMQTMLYRRGEPYGEMSRIRLPAAGAYHTEFMPEDVLVAMSNARVRNIDLLVGNCRHDGRVAVLPMPLPKVLAIQIGNSLFNGLIGNTKAERKALIAKYKSSLPDSDSYTVLERIQSDVLYRMRSIQAAEIHSDTSNGKTYMYQFEYETKGLKGAFGAFHGFDAAFMFNNLSTLGACLGDETDVAEAQALADSMTDAWAAFARTGVPTASGLPEWPEFDAERRQTMMLNARSEVIGDPDAHIRAIWESRRS